MFASLDPFGLHWGAFLLALFALIALANLASMGVAAWRIRRRHTFRAFAVPVSVVVPCRGLEAFSRGTLSSAFTLDYPDYELIFCLADPRDPLIPLIREQMNAHPQVPARILTGDDRISDNPKLNNCVKGWHAARHQWIVLADSNVLMPRNYIRQLLSGWRASSGLVCSPPVGSRPSGFWAEVECAFLNTLQARWQYTAEALGLGFAQGKSMLWRRDLLNAEGGIHVLAREIAEDAAATKAVRAMNRDVHLVDAPFEQPLGERTLRAVWSRQIRWARLRRVTFALCFAPEIFISALVPAMGVGTSMIALGHEPLAASLAVISLLAITYAAETALAFAKGWHVSRRLPLAFLMRDILVPLIWTCAWFGSAIVWQGQKMKVRRGRKEDVADERDRPLPA